MTIHFLFDLLALTASVMVSLWFRRRYQLSHPAGISRPDKYHYYLIALLLGLAAGSTLFGTLNLHLSGQQGLAKSMAGGIVGAIFAAELYKYFSGIRQSTGLYFMPGLIVLIAVGRIGCFYAGLPDYTCGIETALPWGVDFGDGIYRHPVQLYESLTMLLFFIFFLKSHAKNPTFWQQRGFYLFVLVYATQRFCWEFIKPYTPVYSQLNLFHLLCLCLTGYALIMLKRSPVHAP